MYVCEHHKLAWWTTVLCKLVGSCKFKWKGNQMNGKLVWRSFALWVDCHWAISTDVECLLLQSLLKTYSCGILLIEASSWQPLTNSRLHCTHCMQDHHVCSSWPHNSIIIITQNLVGAHAWPSFASSKSWGDPTSISDLPSSRNHLNMQPTHTHTHTHTLTHTHTQHIVSKLTTLNSTRGAAHHSQPKAINHEKAACILLSILPQA